MEQSYNPFSLAGKTILVTGASSGIGRATAKYMVGLNLQEIRKHEEHY